MERVSQLNSFVKDLEKIVANSETLKLYPNFWPLFRKEKQLRKSRMEKVKEG